MKGFEQHITVMASPFSTEKQHREKGSPRPGRIMLGTWLENTIEPSTRFEKAAEAVREARRLKEEDIEEDFKAAKRQIPCMKPSGLFDTSEGDHLITHSGFLQIDLDRGENPNQLEDLEEAKKRIAEFPEVAFVARSTTDGIWGLVRLPEAVDEEAHKKHFFALKKALKRHGFALDDKTKNPGRLRFFSLDPDPIWKDSKEVRPFIAKLDQDPDRPAQPNRTRKHRPIFRPNRRNPLQFAHSIVARQIGPFQDGNKHAFIWRMACIANRMNVPREELETYVSAYLIPIHQVRTNCIRYPFEQLSHEAGTWKKHRSSQATRVTEVTPKKREAVKHDKTGRGDSLPGIDRPDEAPF